MAIHGGTGTIAKKDMTQALHFHYEKCLKKALYAGVAVLQNNGSAVDAVQAAVVELEDCPDFNAARGSAFNRYGSHEMDAAIMDGATLRAGAAAGIQYVKNPILLARAVMEKSGYVLVSGENALRFAQEHRLALEPNDYFFTDHQYQRWSTARERGKVERSQKHGTVGAVALDSGGHLAAATSTGGLVDKAYGRVSDSCVIGGGTYADQTCAVSCTGDGEAFMRCVAAHDIATQASYQGKSLAEACRTVLKNKVQPLGGNGGIIAIDPSGTIEMPFTTEGMYRACFHPNGTIECSIY
jgi:beta-aspartyl-peptidase (threonine type)